MKIDLFVLQLSQVVVFALMRFIKKVVSQYDYEKNMMLYTNLFTQLFKLKTNTKRDKTAQMISLTQTELILFQT